MSNLINNESYFPPASGKEKILPSDFSGQLTAPSWEKAEESGHLVEPTPPAWTRFIDARLKQFVAR